MAQSAAPGSRLRLPQSARIGSRAIRRSMPPSWTRSPGSTGSASTSSGSPSTTSSTTATCRPGSRSRRRWRRAPSSVRFSCDVCLLPFNHPIRLAEDLAVLDNISGGRVEIGVGMGYAPHEFRGFGMPVSRRVSLTDEGLEVLKRAFTGETFSFAGKRYQLHGREDHAGLRAARRPAALGCGDGGGGRAACRAFRRQSAAARDRARSRSIRGWRSSRRRGAILPTIASASSSPAWSPTTASATGRAVRVAERRRMEIYNRFREEAGGHGGVAGITEGKRIPQTWVVGDVEHCVAELVGLHRGIRPDRHRQLGGAARHAARPDQCQPGALRPRCRAATAGAICIGVTGADA